MDGKEITAEGLKYLFTAFLAGLVGWLWAMWKKPSREDLKNVETRLSAVENEHRATAATLSEFRAEFRTMIEGLRESIKGLRSDVRDMRTGERHRDTDP